MINNRQAGRRRGRNNARPNGGGNRGNGESGNRIDSRARGNAAQLLEKYRNMARDAQMTGDRVNAEYYLQFADHYFRVLADNRARQEEQQARFRRPGDNEPDDDYGDDDDGIAGSEAPERDSYPHRQRNFERPRERQAETSPARDDDQFERRERAQPPSAPAPEFALASESAEPAEAAAPRRRGRPRKVQVEANGEAALDISSLPPAIGRSPLPDTAADQDGGDEPAPRPRRGRRPRVATEAAE